MALAGEGEQAWRLHTDGASRGNPGPAAIGFVLTDATGQVQAEESEVIGPATNNVAEYRAVIAGLAKAAAVGARSITVLSDSQLLVRQLQGIYKVRNENLQALYHQVQALARRFDAVNFQHIPREQNQRADELANLALDGQPAALQPAQPAQPQPVPFDGDAVEPTPASPTTAAAATLLRVRYGETDQMGFAYYPNYLDWFTVGRTNYLRQRGVAYAEWENRGIYLPVRRAQCDYRWPAKYDQVVAIQARVTKVTPVRLAFAYEIRLHAQAPAGEGQVEPGTLIATGQTEHGVIAGDGTVLRLDRKAPDLWARLQAATAQPE